MDEITRAVEIFGKYGWQPVLSGATLYLLWVLTRPIEKGKSRPLLAEAIVALYGDIRDGIGSWWDTRRAVLEARRDRDRAIEAAYTQARPGGARTGDRLLPAPAPGRSRNRTTGGGGQKGATERTDQDSTGGGGSHPDSGSNHGVASGGGW